jgi:hypothetical protein
MMTVFVAVINWLMLYLYTVRDGRFFCARRVPRLNVFKGGSVLQPRFVSDSVGQIYVPGDQRVLAGCSLGDSHSL